MNNKTSSETTIPSPRSSHNLQIIRKINQSNSPVFLAYSQKNSKYFALKTFKFHNQRPSFNFLVESRLQWLNHPHIIKMEACFENHKSYDEISNSKTTKKQSSILMELAPYGDFDDLVHKGKISKDEVLARTYFHQLISAIEYLHSNGIAHTDLKLSNILLGNKFNLKLSDFDHACLDEDGEISDKGSENYRAPELKNGNCLDPYAADVYSLGITIFTMISGHGPYSNEGSQLQELMLNGDCKFWETHCQKYSQIFSRSFQSLFFGMTCKDPKKRLTLSQIKEHSWFNKGIYSQDELEYKMQQNVKLSVFLMKN